MALAVTDLADYFTMKDRISALELEVEQLKHRLKLEASNKSKWRTKYEAVKPARKSKRLLKTQRAYDMIAQRESGEIDASLADIGRQCGINYGTLKRMAYDYRQIIKD